MIIVDLRGDIEIYPSTAEADRTWTLKGNESKVSEGQYSWSSIDTKFCCYDERKQPSKTKKGTKEDGDLCA
jgi:hypothetical protein